MDSLPCLQETRLFQQSARLFASYVCDLMKQWNLELK